MAAAVDTYGVHGRPIRPLPKRRLRSRLSDDEAIALFASPPQSPNPTPLFRFPFPYSDFSTGTSPSGVYSGASSTEIPGTEADDQSDDEDRTNLSYSQPPSTVDTATCADGMSNLAADGYDCSENTNNKKKRKIPAGLGAGGFSGSGAGSSVSSQCSGFSPNGPSNSSRTRWKGYTSPRSPLGAVSSGRRIIRRIRPQRLFARPDGLSDDKENVHYHQEQDGSEMVPKAESFDFEYPSSISLAQPEFPPQRMPPSHYQKSMSTVGTQTSPSISNYNASYPPSQQGNVPTPKKKSNRNARPRQRRPTNYLRDQPPNNNGETWICEFCEYESIFGEAPEALMRQYDIKDRKERRKLLEKRRLLEKVKQKGRRNQAKNNSSKKSNQAAAQAPPPPPPSSTDSQGTQSDDMSAPVEACPRVKEHRCEGGHVCEMHSRHPNGRGKNGGRGGGTGGNGPGGGAK